MERLTKRIDGEAVHFDCHGTCGTCDGCTCFEIGGMVDRLTAYEDTGLEPEEIDGLQHRIDENIGASKLWNRKYYDLMAEKLDTTYDHLRDLLAAEKDGRLVALPCKVGDTVYLNFVVDGRDPVTIEVKMHNLLDIANFLPHFGKTVFLTREAADAALGGESDE